MQCLVLFLIKPLKVFLNFCIYLNCFEIDHRSQPSISKGSCSTVSGRRSVTLRQALPPQTPNPQPPAPRSPFTINHSPFTINPSLSRSGFGYAAGEVNGRRADMALIAAPGWIWARLAPHRGDPGKIDRQGFRITPLRPAAVAKLAAAG